MIWLVLGGHQLKIDFKLGINLKVLLTEFADRHSGLSEKYCMCKSLIAFNSGYIGKVNPTVSYMPDCFLARILPIHSDCVC